MRVKGGGLEQASKLERRKLCMDDGWGETLGMTAREWELQDATRTAPAPGGPGRPKPNAPPTRPPARSRPAAPASSPRAMPPATPPPWRPPLLVALPLGAPTPNVEVRSRPCLGSSCAPPPPPRPLPPHPSGRHPALTSPPTSSLHNLPPPRPRHARPPPPPPPSVSATALGPSLTSRPLCLPPYSFPGPLRTTVSSQSPALPAHLPPPPQPGLSHCPVGHPGRPDPGRPLDISNSPTLADAALPAISSLPP
jgi:hypothetical protein